MNTRSFGVSLCISLQFCYHNDLATVATFSFVFSEGRGELMACGMEFPKPRLGESTAANIRQRFRTVHAVWNIEGFLTCILNKSTYEIPSDSRVRFLLQS